VNTGGASAVETGCGCVGVEPTWQTVQDAASLALLCVCQRPVAATMSITANIAAKNISEARQGLARLRSLMTSVLPPSISWSFTPLNFTKLKFITPAKCLLLLRPFDTERD
jgi:hypothetical protein